MRKKRMDLIFLLLFLVLVIGIFPVITPYAPEAQNLRESLQGPSLGHWMGTDLYGRDLLSRIMAGGRNSLGASLLLVSICSLIGSLLGMLASSYRGAIDEIIGFLCDLLLAFPGLVFAIAMAAALGGGLPQAIFSLALCAWPKYARLARSRCLALRESEFILASRLSGRSEGEIWLRHFLPNIVGPILVTAILDLGTMMMEIAGLSFLGLGAKPPMAEWGNMMSLGRGMLQTAPWVILAPGLAIFLSVMVLHILGDRLREDLDPRLRLPVCREEEGFNEG